MTEIRITDEPPIEEGTSVIGDQSFEEFSESMPSDAKLGFGTIEDVNAQPLEEGEAVMEETPARKSLKMSKKMKAAMKRIQEKVASFPVIYFNNKAKIHPEWELDQDEKDIITDSLSFVFDILNINFEIQSLDITLTSIWWVLAYPICAIGMIFVTHKAAADAAHPKEETEDAK